MLGLGFSLLACILIAMMVRSRPYIVFVGFFILFGLLYRIVDIVRLDAVGPVYAIEFERYIGGNGSAPVFIACCLAFILPFWFLFSEQRLTEKLSSIRRLEPYHELASNWSFYGILVLLVVLYLDMLRIGVIPLFADIDRLAYEKIAGILNSPAYEFNFLISTICGIFTFLPRLFGSKLDLRFVALLIAIMAYWALTGHRFSAFFVSLSFFFMPYGGIIALTRAGLLAPRSSQSVWDSLLSTKFLLPIFLTFGSVAVTGLLVNSYYDVRDYSDPLFMIEQRILVQPVQIWASTWDSIRFGHADDINWSVIDSVLINPANPNGNTSIEYLMERELGYFRANELLEAGQQYAGGYPEIFFLMFGIWFGIPLILLFGFMAAFSLFLAVRSFVFGLPVTAILATYVFYGFSLCFIGGMINFVIAPTFLIKISALVIGWQVERSLVYRRGGAVDNKLNLPAP